MKKFSHRFQVKAPLTAVAAFHKDASALKVLTPPPVIVRLQTVEPLAEGSRAVFTLWVGPLPIHWEAIHSQVRPGQGFTDTQTRGPFQTWIHQHSFQELADGRTEVIDEVSAVPSKHLFWGLVSRILWLSLPFLFAYRARQTRKALEPHA